MIIGKATIFGKVEATQRGMKKASFRIRNTQPKAIVTNRLIPRMTKDKMIMGYSLSSSDSFTELATPVKMRGKRSMLNVIRDKNDKEEGGISGDLFGYRVARNPERPIRNVLPTADADATIIESTGDIFVSGVCA
jgi:hypothetical protein